MSIPSLDPSTVVEKNTPDPKAAVYRATSTDTLIQNDTTATVKGDGTALTSADAVATKSNPFPGSDDDFFNLRPMYTAPIPHDGAIATIIITAPEAPAGDAAPGNDYFTNLKAIPGLTVDNSQKGVVAITPFQRFYGVFKNFGLDQVGEATQEVAKVVLNFGLGWTAYFFGQQPRIFTFSGTFLDAKNYPYYEQFMTAYKTHLSGSKIAENGYRFYIVYDQKVVSGYMLGINTSSQAQNRTIKSFQFQVLIDDENMFRTNIVNGTQLKAGDMGRLDNTNMISALTSQGR